MSISKLKALIEKRAREHARQKSDEFLLWYANIRGRNYNTAMFASADGGIDLILHGRREIIMIQGKFGPSKISEVKYFNDTIQAWKKRATFDRWISKEVKNDSAKRQYRNTFNEVSRGNLRLRWEFVYLGPHNLTWESILLRDNHDVRLVSQENLAYYYALDCVGATHTDPVTLKTHGDFVSYVHDTKEGISTYICILDLENILNTLRNEPDIETIFARNVRLEIPGSDVNRQILETYKTDTDDFFFGNSGVHFICTSASFSAGKVRILDPNIINGGQTIRTLLHAPKSKPGGRLLARITEIPSQLQEKRQDFINEVIFRSNSNNKMEPWNLRSNDPLQVNIARSLYAHGVFYERKENEWRLFKSDHPKLRTNIGAVELAQVIGSCLADIGPATIKSKGRVPLFSKTGRGTPYNTIFSWIQSNIEETVTIISIYDSVYSAVPNTKKIPSEYKSFPRACVNYIVSFVWLNICNSSLNHPAIVDAKYSRKSTQFESIIQRMTQEIFSTFEQRLKNENLKQNDIFRNQNLWKETFKKLHSKFSAEEILEAIEKTK